MQQTFARAVRQVTTSPVPRHHHATPVPRGHILLPVLAFASHAFRRSIVLQERQAVEQAALQAIFIFWELKLVRTVWRVHLLQRVAYQCVRVARQETIRLERQARQVVLCALLASTPPLGQVHVNRDALQVKTDKTCFFLVCWSLLSCTII